MRVRATSQTMLVAGLMLALTTAVAQTEPQGQTWPQKSVRFIVPLPPGSGMDLSARLVAERLTERWGSRSWWRTGRAPTASPPSPRS
jgi:tripartite-type tricarboxylate transporter receptor subunit TctC